VFEGLSQSKDRICC